MTKTSPSFDDMLELVQEMKEDLRCLKEDMLGPQTSTASLGEDVSLDEEATND